MSVRCPFCGVAESGGAAMCRSCGGLLLSAPESGPAAPPAPAAGPPAPSNRCPSCGGAKDPEGACPWCGWAHDAHSPERRREAARRAAVVGTVAAVLAVVMAAGTLLWERRQEDNQWKADRANAGTTVADALLTMPLDPARPDAAALESRHEMLFTTAEELLGGDGHERAREKLAGHLREVGEAFDDLAELAETPLAVLDEEDAAEVTAAWAGIVDDVGAVAETTGVRIEGGAAQSRVGAFVTALSARAKVEQNRRRFEQAKSALAAHRTAVELVFVDYEAARVALDRARIEDAESSEFFGPITVFGPLLDGASDRRSLAARLRRTEAPTASLDNRVEEMASLLDEQARLLETITGIGDVPPVKQVMAEVSAAHGRLVAEKDAWSAEIDAELGKIDAELARA